VCARIYVVKPALGGLLSPKGYLAHCQIVDARGRCQATTQLIFKRASRAFPLPRNSRSISTSIRSNCFSLFCSDCSRRFQFVARADTILIGTRSAPRPSFGLPELLVASHTSGQSCCKAGKARVFTPVRESSWESRFMSKPPIEATKR
jgi:hypothetical protein